MSWEAYKFDYKKWEISQKHKDELLINTWFKYISHLIDN